MQEFHSLPPLLLKQEKMVQPGPVSCIETVRIGKENDMYVVSKPRSGRPRKGSHPKGRAEDSPKQTEAEKFEAIKNQIPIEGGSYVPSLHELELVLTEWIAKNQTPPVFGIPAELMRYIR